MTEAPHHHADALKYEDWAGEMGARWLANLTGFESTIAPAGEALLAQAAYQPGERVVDIGFGGGATSLAIAQAVAPQGEVVGIDISPDLAAATARRAAAAGIANARFICADAATVALPEMPFDRLCSRFGSMFFSEPVPAFANLRGLLKAGDGSILPSGGRRSRIPGCLKAWPSPAVISKCLRPCRARRDRLPLKIGTTWKKRWSPQASAM
ncbi:class I SAM-dependent methyltransferase [Novosphingobium sp. THN1]|uniref:class I SAM-dependent methyltransferase n=1 Tax=Novosphingobium sp. THN1 TaxID=1016987 RepID=UPI001F078FD6|nr:class I SAM-dependent methyltransferase [Novosphingobium sp. THN1]